MAEPHLATCLPMSVCSWDFRVRGLEAGPAEVKLKHFSEQGLITVGGHELVVRKHGVASGRWTIEHEGQEVAEAHKPSAFRNRFLLSSAGQSWTLQRPSVFSRTFRLTLDPENTLAATIEPMHAFTRRATITHTGAVPAPVLLFAFWLAALIWRRDAQSD